MKKLLLPLIALCCFATLAVAQQDTVVEEIVARVNNAIITRADLRHNREQTAQEAKEQNLSQTQVDERTANALRDLIDQQLLIQKAADLGITADADLVKRLDDLRKEMHAGSLEDLQKMAEAQGISWEDFKQNTKNSILTQKVVGSEVGSHIQVTREEAQKYYDEHKGELTRPERIRLSEILISTNPAAAKSETQGQLQEPTQEQIAAAETRAQDVYQQLKGGAKFDELARKESNSATAEQGGDLGYFKRNDLAKELEEKTFALKPGEFTQPIRTRQGFIILRVTDHIEAGTPSMESVHNQIQEALYSQKIQPALRDYLTKLREEAYIDIKPGYTDTGASPNETQLIYTSDSGPRTKQVRGKLGIGKKKTIVVVGHDKNEPAPTGSTSELGRAKSDVDAKTKAENDRKAAEAVAAKKAAAEAAEKEKLSKMSPKERKHYLEQKRHAEKQAAYQQSKEEKQRKKAAKKEAKRKAQEAKGKRIDPTEVTAEDESAKKDAGADQKKKKSWF